MKPRIFSSLGPLCCAVALITQPVQADTLQEIFLDAVNNDHQYKAAQAELEAGRENIKVGRAALLPQLGGEATWNRRYPSGSDIQPESKEYFVGLSQNIVNLPAWYNYQGRKALTNLAEAEFLAAQQDLIIRVANAYFDALEAVDTLLSAKAEEEALSHQLEQTRQRFEVGLTAITEVHEAQAAYDSATANRLVADGNLGIAFEALEVLTGRPHEQLAPLKDDFPVTSPEPLARDEWVEQALEHNVSLQVARFAADAAKSTAKAARSEHLPSLSGRVGYSKTEQDARAGQVIGGQVDGGQIGLGQDSEGGFVSLTLNVPLYSGGSISATRRLRANEALAERERFLQQQRAVVQQARSNHLAVLTSAATVKARAQAITSARSALEATQAGYDVGTRDLVDVLDAQRNLYRNQRDYFDALYAYVMSTLQLREAAGMLDAEDIASLNEWLDETRAEQYSR